MAMIPVETLMALRRLRADRRGQLETMATEPEPVIEEPLPEEPGRGRQALAALADALSTYAAIKGGIPGAQTDFLGDLRRQRQERSRVLASREAQKTLGESKSRRERAKLELERLEREETAEAAEERRKREKEAETATSTEAEAVEHGIDPAGMAPEELRAAIAAKRRTREKAAEEAKAYEREYELKFSAAKAGVTVAPGMKEQEILGKIAARERGKEKKEKSDEDRVAARKQKQLLANAKSFAIDMKRGVPANEAKGIPAIPSADERFGKGETPVELLEEFEEELDALGLEGDARREALDYFHSKVGSPGLKQPGALGITGL